MTTHWHLIACKEGREPTIAEEIDYILGRDDAYYPYELRRWKPCKRARKDELYRVPLIPRLVFTTAPESISVALAGNPYFAGIERDAFGIPWTIPDNQMKDFIAAHNDWLAKERNRLKSGGRGRPAKRKWRKLDGASAGEIMSELFGAEQAQEAA